MHLTRFYLPVLIILALQFLNPACAQESSFDVSGQLLLTETPELYETIELRGGYTLTRSTFRGRFRASKIHKIDLTSVYEGSTWTLSKSSENEPKRSEAVYTFWLADINGGNNGSAVVAGEFVAERKDNPRKIWVITGTGSYYRANIVGTWSAAQELNGMQGLPFGVDQTIDVQLSVTPNSADNDAPNTLNEMAYLADNAGGGTVVEDYVHELWADPAEFHDNRNFGSGWMLNRHGTVTKLVGVKSDHPLDGAETRIAYFVAYRPDKPLGAETHLNTIHSSSFAAVIDSDRDMFMQLAEYSPARGDTYVKSRSVFGTGKYKNASISATWRIPWPDGYPRLDDLQGMVGQDILHYRIEFAK